jgi:hypothetical protein
VIIFATSAIEVGTLVTAAIAAVSGIGAAIVAGLFAMKSERNAEARAQAAEDRAAARAIELEEREEQREAERWRVERIRTAYDLCTDLTEQGLSTLQQLALSVPELDPTELISKRRELHPQFAALQRRIVLLGQEMNAIGETSMDADLGLGMAAKDLVESLNAGRETLANQSTTAQDLMDAFGVAESGLARFRLKMRDPLLGGK